MIVTPHLLEYTSIATKVTLGMQLGYPQKACVGIQFIAVYRNTIMRSYMVKEEGEPVA